ncbi:hypothetical protein LAZ67_10000014 [Cordylochernes scorpioides]|uniref:CCHC-type domain-containing protein n=1 Tax=Cordylochernes scorpioides TaxID=51811 RepID=A0ABY6KWU5_9ARAC|nr:hypothetical protein LAZ67_10000014 [Cordylochernes scorpioides]
MPKKKTDKSPGLLKPIPPATFPLQRIRIYILGRFPKFYSVHRLYQNLDLLRLLLSICSREGFEETVRVLVFTPASVSHRNVVCLEFNGPPRQSSCRIQLRIMPAERENAPTSQVKLPSMMYNLEKFEGEGIVPFTKFIRDFELVYDLGALDDARKRILLDNHLRGASREFAFQSQQIRLGYEELKESLERRFRKRVSTREMRSQFFSCRQRAGEKVRDFVARVSDLAAEAELDGLKIGISEVAEVFIDGLCPSLEEDYKEAQRSNTDKSGQRLGDMANKLAELEKKMRVLEAENSVLRRQEGNANTRNDQVRRWPIPSTGRGDYRGTNVRDNRREAPHRNWQGRPTQQHQPFRQQRPPPPPRQERRDLNRGREENPRVNSEGQEDTVRPRPKCYKCGEPGHRIRDCQQNATKN